MCEDQATTKDPSKFSQLIHEGIRHPCNACDNKASPAQDLKRHKQTVHERNRKYECDPSDFKSTMSNRLKVHQQCVHGTTEYKSDNCGFLAPTEVSQTSHKRQCNECEYQATTKTSLNIHSQSIH